MKIRFYQGIKHRYVNFGEKKKKTEYMSARKIDMYRYVRK